MTSVIITTLVDVPLVVSFSNRESLPVRPGNWFDLPIVVTSKAEHSIEWTHQNPLKLSYRWVDQDGTTIERDGRRTEFTSGSFMAGERLDVDLGGVAPEEAGLYELQVSLVLEGVQWACEVGSAGWVTRLVQVSAAPAWPAKLEQSCGGRALRGALVANELAWILQKRPLAMGDDVGEIESTSTPRSLSSEVDAPPRFLQRVRNRVRAVLGISGLERQLEGVLLLASQQDEHAQDLEKQLAAFKEEVLAGLGRSQIGAPKVLEDVSDARRKLSAKLVSRDRPKRARFEGKQVRAIEPRGKLRKAKNISGTSLP